MLNFDFQNFTFFGMINVIPNENPQFREKLRIEKSIIDCTIGKCTKDEELVKI